MEKNPHIIPTYSVKARLQSSHLRLAVAAVFALGVSAMFMAAAIVPASPAGLVA